MKTYTQLTYFFATLFLFGSFAFAEPDHAHKKHPRHEKMFQKMKETRSKMLREEIGLDETRAQEVESTLASFDEKRHAIKKQMHQSRRALKKLLKADSNDQNAYKEALSKLRKVHQQMHELRENQIDAVSKKLTPKEQAKMLSAMHKMKRHMKKQMKHKRKKHHEKLEDK